MGSLHPSFRLAAFGFRPRLEGVTAPSSRRLKASRKSGEARGRPANSFRRNALNSGSSGSVSSRSAKLARGLAAAARPCYVSFMTCLLDEAVATVASLPDEQQDEFARILLQLVGHEQPVYVLTPEEEADLDASIAAEERGDFATDGEMLAIRAKYAR
jgi:hypothetical protein